MSSALAMRYRLAQLAKQWNVVPAPCSVSLSEPVDYPVIVEGLASTTDLDLSRQQFRPYAFCNPCILLERQKPPPLYYKHNESKIVVEYHAICERLQGERRAKEA